MNAALRQAVTIIVGVDAGMWLVGLPPTLWYAFAQGALPRVGGIRLLGGPFERLGLDALIVAGIIFIVISALKLLAADWLWQARRDGVVLAAILLGLSVIFWYGFALPLGPLVGGVEAVLLALAWRARRSPGVADRPSSAAPDD